MFNNRDIYAMNLPHRATVVYMYLCDRADKDGKCFPSVNTMAAELKISRRTVQREIKDLEKEKEKEKLLRTEQRIRLSGGRSSTLYLIN